MRADTEEDTQRRQERAVTPQGRTASQTKGVAQAGRQLLAPFPGLMSYFTQFYKLVESNTVLQLYLRVVAL